MRLDRKLNPDGRGKYALIKLREYPVVPADNVADGGTTPVLTSAIDMGNTPDTEFFVIRLKDKYAAPALQAYADAAILDGETEYGEDILELADRASQHPNSRRPD